MGALRQSVVQTPALPGQPIPRVINGPINPRSAHFDPATMEMNLSTGAAAQVAMSSTESTHRARCPECPCPTDGGEMAIDERTSLSQLRSALFRGEVCVHYQPILDLRTGALAGVEALARWQHPQFGCLLPEVFVPIAERDPYVAGLLGEVVLGQALDQVARWQTDGFMIDYVAVNLSVAELKTPNFLERVTRQLSQSGIFAERICFEISESQPVCNKDTDALRLLGEMGFQLAIDDFGTGYAHLGALRKLPVQQVKIDRSLIHSCASSNTDRKILKAIVSLVHDLGMTTVLEGIEQATQLQTLIELEGDFGQGYYFSPPATPERVVGMSEWFGGRPRQRILDPPSAASAVPHETPSYREGGGQVIT